MNTITVHVMIPEGHGIATSNRFYKACDTFRLDRPVVIPPAERNVAVDAVLPDGLVRCDDCSARVEAGLR